MQKQVDLTKVRPYGDTLDDGMMQFSFTLPVPYGPRAQEAAKLLLMGQGFENPSVTAMEELHGATYFVAYARCPKAVNFEEIYVPQVDTPTLEMDEINELVEKEIGRKVVVIGACTGTDAHTVGIDAIMNMKGFHGHYGLERYSGLRAINMGAQVPNEVLVARAIKEGADAILVSQVVTQKNAHVHNLTNLIEVLEAEGVRGKLIAVVGGPRITHELATELGFDAGFGPHSYAEDVASFNVHELIRRK
ncbi:MAG: OAM dimerization domain-containing protein [Bacteroidota bacterium]